MELLVEANGDTAAGALMSSHAATTPRWVG